jgi:hypothetical protein
MYALETTRSQGAVRINNGPLLTEWDESGICGERDNRILWFSWMSFDGRHDVVLTEGMIADGAVTEDGAFHVPASGNILVFRFFALVPFTP